MKNTFRRVRPEDFDVELLRQAAREGKLYIDEKEGNGHGLCASGQSESDMLRMIGGHFLKAMAELNEKLQMGSTSDHSRNDDDDEALVAELMPIFYNNEEDVRRFLKEIRGMAQEDITSLVNQWVDEKRISNYGNSRKGVLWHILKKAGLYKRTVQNWNRRVV